MRRSALCRLATSLLLLATISCANSGTKTAKGLRCTPWSPEAVEQLAVFRAMSGHRYCSITEVCFDVEWTAIERALGEDQRICRQLKALAQEDSWFGGWRR